MANVLEQALRSYGGFDDALVPRLAPELSARLGGPDAALDAVLRRSLEERAREQITAGGMPGMPAPAAPASLGAMGAPPGMEQEASPFLPMDATPPMGMGMGMGAAPPPPAPMFGGLGQSAPPMAPAMPQPTPPSATVPGIKTPGALDFESDQRGGMDILAGIGSAGETFANRMADARGAPGTRTTPIADQFRALRESDTQARTQQAAEERVDRTTELQQQDRAFEAQRSLGTDSRAERITNMQVDEGQARLVQMQAELDAAEVEAAQNASLRDPESPISRRAAEIYAQSLPGVDLSGLSLADINAVQAAASGAQSRMDQMKAAGARASAARQAALIRRSEIDARKIALVAEGMPAGKAEIVAADDTLLRKYLEPSQIAALVAPPPGFSAGGPIDPKDVKAFNAKAALVSEQGKILEEMEALQGQDSPREALLDKSGKSDVRDKYNALRDRALINQVKLAGATFSKETAAAFESMLPRLTGKTAVYRSEAGPLAGMREANQRMLNAEALGINLIPPPEAEKPLKTDKDGNISVTTSRGAIIKIKPEKLADVRKLYPTIKVNQ